MKKFIIQAVFLLLVIFGSLYYVTNPTNSTIPFLPFLPQPSKQTQVTIGSNTINVDLADNVESRRKGLGGRDSLASDSGMLFIFDKTSKYSFWMKGMKFAIDIIWIKGDMVVDIIKNVPPPTTDQADNTLPVYQPTQAVDKVLEVNAGYVDSYNIQQGDKVEIK